MLESINAFVVDYGYALLMLAVFLVTGYAVSRMPVVRWAFLPGSLLAGFLLLLLGPQVAGAHFPAWQLPDLYYAKWEPMPALLINVVFACLFLARPALPFRDMWRTAGPQIAFGQTLAWGQYLVGGLLTLAVLTPLFGANPLTGALIEISFEGGHGTSSGLAPVFDQVGFSEGKDLAIALATVSLTAALVSGMILVHWGRRRHHIKLVHHESALQHAYHRRILQDLRRRGVRIREHLRPSRVASHLLLTALAVFFGWLMYQGLVLLEQTTWAQHSRFAIFQYMPMFPLCMFGGMIAHRAWERLGFSVSRSLVELISSFALSILITTAVGTMSLNYIVSHPEIFGLLALSGILWILFGFVFLARRMFREHWFQNGIVNMAQSMGMTATGLLFLHLVDPKDQTSSMESFGYKQLLFEPFVGGGIVTALSMPLILSWGLPTFTAVAGIICAAWLVLGLRYFGRMRQPRTATLARARSRP